ncbi:MAG: hypothetical protein B6D68_02200 [spirochete symbiont of Stewartia floridana]|nr:MAG: hypothetical protein B6D68_02200 [spirochete symbiont of Stewartia floridana]
MKDGIAPEPNGDTPGMAGGADSIRLSRVCFVISPDIRLPEVFERNRSDPAAVSSQIEKFRHRFNLERIMIAGDRGMLTEARINSDLRGREGLD